MNMVEVAKVAYAAGVTDPGDLGRVVSVAFAESGGNPNAHNSRPPDDSYGLWQINMLGNLGPARRQQFNITDNSALFDPATNAKAMVAISGGGKNLHPWSTYGGLRYYAFLSNSMSTAAMVAGATAVNDTAQSAMDATQTGVAQLVKAGSWASNRNNWFRVAKVAVGGALIIAGLNAVTRPYTMRAASTIAGVVAPVGKAAKVVGSVGK